MAAGQPNAASVCILASLLLLAACGLSRADEAVGFVNLDLESGKEPWGVWYSDDPKYAGPRFEYGPDTTVAKSGKASMRIVATSRDACAFVHQSTDKFRPGAQYELSYWVKLTSPDMAKTCDIKINMRYPSEDGKGLRMKAVTPSLFSQPAEGGWTHRRGCFTVDKHIKFVQIGLHVRDVVGTVWYDDIRIREFTDGQVSVDSMYVYYPLQVKLEGDMVRRFGKLASAKSPFL
ncbi:MAG: hypothetical protein FJ279_37390, partial [Planctomycetes bacterium]|nr:hypothetical protein [Planctomycetota bacterium]